MLSATRLTFNVDQKSNGNATSTWAVRTAGARGIGGAPYRAGNEQTQSTCRDLLFAKNRDAALKTQRPNKSELW